MRPRRSQLSPPPSFFSDSSTAYPVTIDPSATLGVNLNDWVDRTYNSLSSNSSGFGTGWTGSPGALPDLAAHTGVNGTEFTFTDPSGTTFYVPAKTSSTWTTPNEMDASFQDAFGYYIVTYHHTRGDHSAGEQLLYSASAPYQLLGIKDHHGDTIFLDYNSSNTEVTQVGDTQDRSYPYTYDASGEITGIADPNGPQSTGSGNVGISLGYGYTNGELTSYTDADGKTTHYGYTGGLLTQITDPDGHVIKVQYLSGTAEVESLTYVGAGPSGSNDVTQFAYSPGTQPTGNTSTTAVTDADDHTPTTYTWDNADRVTKTVDARNETQQTHYDADSNVTAITDNAGAGNVTTNVFDAQAGLLSKVQLMGPTISSGSAGPKGGDQARRSKRATSSSLR